MKCPCGRPVRVKRWGLCQRCYARLRYQGEILTGIKPEVLAFQVAMRNRRDARDEAVRAALSVPRLASQARQERLERGMWIAELVRSGRTLREIGEGLGVTKARVGQMLAVAGKTVRECRSPKTKSAPSKDQVEADRIQRRVDSLTRRFLANVAQESECRAGMDTPCWAWMGYSRQIKGCREGYMIPLMAGPRYTAGEKVQSSVPAYRVAFMLFKGDIPMEPKRMAVDHICFNPMCVNPDHLQLLTGAENSARKDPNRRVGRATPPHCKRGHEFTEANTYVWRGRRQCRKCARIRRAVYDGAQGDAAA